MKCKYFYQEKNKKEKKKKKNKSRQRSYKLGLTFLTNLFSHTFVEIVLSHHDIMNLEFEVGDLASWLEEID